MQYDYSDILFDRVADSPPLELVMRVVVLPAELPSSRFEADSQRQSDQGGPESSRGIST